MVKEINAKTFDKVVLQAKRPVLVEVWAPWCGPCRAMAPVLETVATKFAGQAKVVKLNANQNRELVQQYKVIGIPTLLYFSHSRLVDRQTGAQTAAKIEQRLAPLLAFSAETAAKQEITGLFRWPTLRTIGLIGAGLGLLLLAGYVEQQFFG